MRSTIFILITLLSASIPGWSDVLLVGDRVDVEQKTEARFDVPDGCVITGIGFRAHADNITTMHLRYHRLTPAGELIDPATVHVGSEPDHACEAKIYLPEGYVIVGYGAGAAPEWDIRTLRVWGRPLMENGTLGEVEVFEDGREPKSGLERVVLPSESDRVLVGAGLRLVLHDVAGIYGRTKRLLAIDEHDRTRLSQFSVRGWMVEGVTTDFIREVHERASQYGVNTLVLSVPPDDVGGTIPSGTVALENLRELVRRRTKRNIDVYLWAEIPDFYLDTFEAVTKPRLLRILHEVEGIHGLVLNVEPFEWNDDSKDRLVNAVASLSVPGKDIITRLDLSDPSQIRAAVDFVEDPAFFIPPLVPGTSDRPALLLPATVDRCDPYYPTHPLLGRFPDRKILMEIDLSERNFGRCLIPYARPGEIQTHVVTAGLAGADGVIARIGNPGLSTLGSLNEFNLWCLSKIIDDPLHPLDPLWNEYFSARCGGAADRIITAMGRTRSAVNLTYHVREFPFLSDQSRLAGIRQAEKQLRDGLAAWRPELEPLRDELENPTTKVLERAMDEKETLFWLIEQCLADIEAVRGKLSPSDFEPLDRSFRLLQEFAHLWREWTRTYFLTQIYSRDASERTLGALRESVEDFRERFVSAQGRIRTDFPLGDIGWITAEVDERIHETREASPLAMAFQRVQQLEAEAKYEEAAQALHSLMTDERFVPYLHEHHDRLALLSSSLHALGGPSETIRVKRGADGIWTIERKEGKWCWASTEGKPVIYFDAVAGPFEEPTDYVLTFEYFDEGEKKLGVDYDSAYPEGPYHPVEPIQVTNTGEWKEGRFVLDKAMFKGGQNVESDLRFIQGLEIMRIRNVNLEPKED